MKEGILILCALLCMHVAYGYPADLSTFQDAAAVAQELDHPKPPKPQEIEQETMIAAETEDAQPSPPLPNGMAFMKMLNAIINGDFNAKTQQVSVPYGLKSTEWSVRLQMLIHNHRAEAVRFWWVDYSGQPVLYAYIPSGVSIRQLTFGTHPWLVTTPNGDLITSIVPNTSNLELTIKNTASWSK